MKEAMLFERLPDGRVRCGLCAHHCTIADGERGLCQVRENRGGTLCTLVYGRTITQHVDPMEKKPLFHAVRMDQHAQQLIAQQGIKVVLGVPPAPPGQLVSDYLDGKVTSRNHG